MLGSLRKPEYNTVEVVRLGVMTYTISNELVVKDFQKESPAADAGVKRGDIIVSIDGRTITANNEFVSLMNNKQLGDNVLLVINRNGQQIKFDIKPKVIKVLPTAMKIINLLLENNKVTVAIIVSEVKNSFRNVPADWEDSMRSNLQSAYERGLLKMSDESGFPNLSIVDRARLKQILHEFQFGMSGFVSDKLRAKIGEMTGATHIVDISYSRFPSRFGQDDLFNARLIEIETGKILAVDHGTAH